MHHYGKLVGDVEQINFQMQQPIVAVCIAAEQFLSQTQSKSRWSGKEPCPGLSLAPRGAVRAGAAGTPGTHTSSHHSLLCVLASGHSQSSSGPHTPLV